jgi:hypothetical protein
MVKVSTAEQLFKEAFEKRLGLDEYAMKQAREIQPII